MKHPIHPMDAQQIEALWVWLSLRGFTRQHPPNDQELAGLARVADAELAPWHIRLFLRQATKLEEAA
jgi:hypothetical protein